MEEVFVLSARPVIARKWIDNISEKVKTNVDVTRSGSSKSFRADHLQNGPFVPVLYKRHTLYGSLFMHERRKVGFIMIIRRFESCGLFEGLEGCYSPESYDLF